MNAIYASELIDTDLKNILLNEIANELLTQYNEELEGFKESAEGRDLYGFSSYEDAILNIEANEDSENYNWEQGYLRGLAVAINFIKTK